MRLGQIARKLDITPAELSAFLVQHFGAQDWGTNSRLTEEQLARALRQFAPNQADSFFQSVKSEEPETPAEATPAAVTEPVAEKNPEPPTAPQPEHVEMIKAPKIELSGLKVLGKIELPEKKKKPAPEGTELPAEGVAAGRNPRRKPYPREERPQPKKNPIALQREREEREALRKKQEEAKRLKEKKADRYFKAVQEKAAKVTKAPRLVKEDFEVVTPLEEKPLPTTWWGKLMRWLNT